MTATEQPVTEGFWSAEDTTPSAIGAALERLLSEQALQGGRAYAPARVLNLLVVVDPARRGDVLERLERIGRVNPSRTILCLVEEGRTTLDAWASMACEVPSEDGALAVCRERIEVQVGAQQRLDSVVDSLLVAGLPVVVWSPHGLDEPFDTLSRMADAVLIDSREAAGLTEAVEHAAVLSRRAAVVDLAWLRTTPWRERLAAAFEPVGWRRGLAEVNRVEVRHGEDSAVSALLMAGWLVSRLGWAPLGLRRGDCGVHARASSEEGEVEICLLPVELDVPGLVGVTVETSTGLWISLDRGLGGLASKRRDAEGKESSWTVLGASRGEGGVLGHALREALVSDPAYRPALTAAAALLG